MVANHLFRQIGIRGHHRRDDAVADHHVKETHVVAGGYRNQHQRGSGHAPENFAAQRQQPHQEKGQQNDGDDFRHGGKPFRHAEVGQKGIETTIKNGNIQKDTDVKRQQKRELLLRQCFNVIHATFIPA